MSAIIQMLSVQSFLTHTHTHTHTHTFLLYQLMSLYIFVPQFAPKYLKGEGRGMRIVLRGIILSGANETNFFVSWSLI